MTTATRQRALYVLLGLAVIWGVYNFNRPTEPKSTIADAPSAVVVSPQAPPSSAMVDIADYESKPWGRDPFRGRSQTAETRSTSSASPSSQTWKLSGIVYSDEQPLAIVNNRPVRVGDQINGATVVDINKRQVTLESGGNRVTLTVTPKG